MDRDFPVRDVIGKKSARQKMVETCFRVLLFSAPWTLSSLRSESLHSSLPLLVHLVKPKSFYISENRQM